ncbi:AAA family ATPase [Agrobacterium vaccinii]|uniref:AAA family ATPase n=1 Tax=Agrobacterium vaccinii TaxID=2735528 RepID=UPI001E2D19CD|nr:AAA family ATPase [Agrobacterium vaccinii]UHS55592.1 ATP-binding protein [Agrobacterium vaccinii]
MSVNMTKVIERRERKRQATAIETARIAEMPPVIRSFKLFGLNRFKDVGIHFEAPVKVVAAENGSGKTTVTNALYAILVDKPELLSRIDFDHFVLELNNFPVLRFKKTDLFPREHIEIAMKNSDFDSFMLSQWPITSVDVQEMLLEYTNGTLEDHPMYDHIYIDSPYTKDDITEAFESLSNAYQFKASAWAELQKGVKFACADFDVVYLPTYRRVEADLPQYRKSKVHRRGRRFPSLLDEGEDNLINFGLADVQEKVDNLLTEIKQRTLTAYSQISRNTLQHLATRQTDTGREGVNFEQDDIKVIFARLPDDNSAAEAAVLKLIENGTINRPANRNLRNFLSQLVDAFNETRHSESTISKFVEIVNDYFDNGFKEKEIVYDKFNVSVEIKNTINGTTLLLNNLSSGEKQIVSIFSRLCLNRTRKAIILIDEPELSLSMDWQKALLPDLWMTGNCAQIVAITHSPFIFQNDFDIFAGSMELAYNNTKQNDI